MFLEARRLLNVANVVPDDKDSKTAPERGGDGEIR